MGLSECYNSISSYSPKNNNINDVRHNIQQVRKPVEQPVEQPVEKIPVPSHILSNVEAPVMTFVTIAPEQMKVINDYFENQLLINRAILMLLIFFIMIKLCNK